MVWALNTIVGDPTRKLVLVAYANHAHKDGASAWASAESIAEYAECSERTVQRHTSALIEMGLLREGDQEVIPARIPKRHRPIVYDLAMSEEIRAEWAASPIPGRRAAMVAGGRKGADKRNLLRSVPDVGRQIDAPPREASSTAEPDTSPQVPDPRGDNRGDNRGDTGVTQTKELTKRQPEGQGLADSDAEATLPGMPPKPHRPTANPKTPDPVHARATALCSTWWNALHQKPLGRDTFRNVVLIVADAIRDRDWTEDQLGAALRACGPAVTVNALNAQLARLHRSSPAPESGQPRGVALARRLHEQEQAEEAAAMAAGGAR